MTHVAEASMPSPETAEKSDAAVGVARARRQRIQAFLRTHRVFLAVLAAGLGLRVVTLLGYRWAMWFNDAYEYVETAINGGPHIVRPNGYVFLLKALEPFHSFALVTALQHLMGLGTAIMIYALLRRRFGLAGWISALAAAPVVLDAYQLQLEHMILSDTPFTFLMTLLVTLVLWWRDVTIVRGALLGGLLGITVLTRSVGLAVLIVLIGYLLIRGTRWRVLAVTIVTCAVPLIGYAAWFNASYDRFALSNSDGPFLYARAMKFADCRKFDPPVEELYLCTQTAPADRPSSQFYVWGRVSPLHRQPGDIFEKERSALAGDFAKRAITAQPGDYVNAVGYDVLRVFFWDREIFPDRYTYNMYQFRKTTEPIPAWAQAPLGAYEHGRTAPQIVEPFAGFMRFYQHNFFLRGTMLGLVLLAAVAGMARQWRRLGGPALLPFGVVAGLLVTPAASAEFDYRYVIPAVPMAFLAAAIAWRTRRGDEQEATLPGLRLGWPVRWIKLKPAAEPTEPADPVEKADSEAPTEDSEPTEPDLEPAR